MPYNFVYSLFLHSLRFVTSELFGLCVLFFFFSPLVNIICFTLPFISQNYSHCHGFEIYSWSWQNHFWALYMKGKKKEKVHKEKVTTTLITESCYFTKTVRGLRKWLSHNPRDFRSIMHIKTHQKFHLTVGIGCLHNFWLFYSAFLSLGWF